MRRTYLPVPALFVAARVRFLPPPIAPLACARSAAHALVWFGSATTYHILFFPCFVAWTGLLTRARLVLPRGTFLWFHAHHLTSRSDSLHLSLSMLSLLSPFSRFFSIFLFLNSRSLLLSAHFHVCWFIRTHVCAHHAAGFRFARRAPLQHARRTPRISPRMPRARYLVSGSFHYSCCWRGSCMHCLQLPVCSAFVPCSSYCCLVTTTTYRLAAAFAHCLPCPSLLTHLPPHLVTTLPSHPSLPHSPSHICTTSHHATRTPLCLRASCHCLPSHPGHYYLLHNTTWLPAHHLACTLQVPVPTLHCSSLHCYCHTMVIVSVPAEVVPLRLLPCLPHTAHTTYRHTTACLLPTYSPYFGCK